MLGLSSAKAQTTNSLADARYSRADTLRAVGHLFAKRTKGAVGYTSAGASIVSASLFRPKPDEWVPAIEKQSTRGGWLFGGAMLGYGAARLSRYGAERFEQITAAYEQGEPLPPYVRRQLKTKYFRYRPF
ncbi:hypothetical protein EJV47_19045 [Hymenobacter gummosus]|uniref:Uncharacterized protein n=1 Tax=Hymenobacter gummosus TaxID=1776032 RepID=A0A431TZE4_9BACT|nr:hypothetical protein [Hymenobacter gummosus]RTQ47516.1 hypothetical protein EJV47_19045 [Hymenobacter gummosus]